MAMSLGPSLLRMTEAKFYGKPWLVGLTGYVKRDGTTELTGDWNAGNYKIDSQNSLRWFNVKAYGATGDGTTDDRTAIVNTISAAGAVKGVVYFPPGSYKISATISVTPPIAFVGDDRDASIILLPDNSVGFDFATHPGGLLPAVWFRDLQFKTFSGGAATSGAFIYVHTSPSDLQFFMDRCKIGYHYRGLVLNSIEYSTISRTMFIISNNTAGSSDIHIENINNPDAGDITISDCHFSTGTVSSINIKVAGGVRIVNNKFGGQPAGQYILVDIPIGIATGLLFVNENSFQGYPVNAHIRFATSGIFNISIITGNEFTIYADSAPAHIVLAPDATAFLYGLTITGNFFIDGAYAIHMDPAGVDGIQSCVIDGNNFYFQSTTAIRLPNVAGRCFNINIGNNGFLPDGATSYVTGDISGHALGNQYQVGKVSIGMVPVPPVPTNSRLLVTKNLTGLPVDTAGTIAQFCGEDAANCSLLVDAAGATAFTKYRVADNTMAAPSAIAAGRVVGITQATGYNGTSFVVGANQGFFSTEAAPWAVGATGMGISWAGTMAGATGQAERMRLHDDALSIGYQGKPSAGRLLVSGYAAAPQAGVAGTIAQFCNVEGQNALLTVDSFASAQYPGIALRGAAGTSGVPLTVIAAQVVGRYDTYGYDGTAYALGGRIESQSSAAADWNIGDHGTAMTFTTAGMGGTTLYECLRLVSSAAGPAARVAINFGGQPITTVPSADLHVIGNAYFTCTGGAGIGVGVAPSASYLLNVGSGLSSYIAGHLGVGTAPTTASLAVGGSGIAGISTVTINDSVPPGGAGAYGLHIVKVATASGAGGVYGMVSDVSATNAVGTVGTLAGVYSTVAGPAAGGTVTSAIGFHATGTVGTGTVTSYFGSKSEVIIGASVGNRYGYYVAASIGAGAITTNEYGLYVEALAKGAAQFAVYTAGTTPSYFGGTIIANSVIKVGSAGTTDYPATNPMLHLNQAINAFEIATFTNSYVAGIAGAFLGLRAKGTGANGAVVNAQPVGGISFYGYNSSSAWDLVASGIQGIATETHTNAAQGMKLTIQTVAAGGTTSSTKITIPDGGGIQIHDVVAPTVAANQIGLGTKTSAVIGANGAASALTANPVGYWKINVGGTMYQLPFYNV